MATVNDVVNALVHLTGKITTQKLQKLLYYCQAWHLVQFNTPLFVDEIQAWREGPVVRSVYAKHRGNTLSQAGHQVMENVSINSS